MNAPRLQVPVFLLPEHLREWHSIARLAQAVSTYENLVQGNKPSYVKTDWNVALAIKYASKLTPDMQCVEAWMEIPIGAIDRLLDCIKTAVLGYAIEFCAPDISNSKMPNLLPRRAVRGLQDQG